MSESGKFHYQNLDRRRDKPAYRLTPVGSRADGEGGLVHFADDRRMKVLCKVRGAGYRGKTTDPGRVTCPVCLERLKATKSRGGSMGEQRICTPQVPGSSPGLGSDFSMTTPAGGALTPAESDEALLPSKLPPQALSGLPTRRATKNPPMGGSCAGLRPADH